MRNYDQNIMDMDKYLEEKKDEMISFLQEFIRIKSITYEEKEAVEFLAGKMKEYGYDEVRIDKVGNVLGRIGNGPITVMYDAHIDTVELGDISKWEHHPLSADLADGYIWGRGTVDDKGPLAAIVWAGKLLKDLNLQDKITMWVSGSLSEEDVEGSCVDEMMKVNPDIKPDYLVVAEASEMQVMKGNKGRAMIKITVPGVAAHASVGHTGDNALIKALPIIAGIDKLTDLGDDPFLGKGTIEVTNVVCNTPSNNTIPGEVTIFCDRRISCGESKEDLIKEIQPFLDLAPGSTASIDMEHFNTWNGYAVAAEDFFPSWLMDEDSKVITAGVEAFEMCFKQKCNVGVWPFSTNATTLCGKHGIPTVGFGPSIEELCHSDKEKISVEEYVDAAKFYALLGLTISNKQ
ncbi:MAG: YgeY family selenium metabolism-linked hydrolase [Firmicutes bacterium]|nr:YgeY family selenium metabolism-linked hydrolase [Bacillota bacterium]